VERDIHIIGERQNGFDVLGLHAGEDVITDAEPSVKHGDRIRRKKGK
jgi:hypothetical protein